MALKDALDWKDLVDILDLDHIKYILQPQWYETKNQLHEKHWKAQKHMEAK